MIFLDNAGTTKMFDECVDVYQKYACEEFFNPSALSMESLAVSKKIAEVEKFILSKLGANAGNILFTGCATESNNLAIKGSLRTGDWEYVFSEGEHPSVYNVAKKMTSDGLKVHFVPLNKKGEVDLTELRKVLSKKTRLISIMHVSNETGAINNLEEVSKIKKELCPNAILHVDGVQGFMKISCDLRKTEVDLYSFSGHKIHGPKGISGLYVKNKNGLKELFQGGGQQFGLRSGTENVPGVMQLQKAVEMIDAHKNFDNVSNLKKCLRQYLCAIDGIKSLGFDGSPYIDNYIFSGVKGETMLHALNKEGVVVGLGSACSAKKAGNRILEHIGVSKEDVISSVRVSFNAYQSVEEIEKAAKIIAEVYQDIKKRVS